MGDRGRARTLHRQRRRHGRARREVLVAALVGLTSVACGLPAPGPPLSTASSAAVEEASASPVEPPTPATAATPDRPVEPLRAGSTGVPCATGTVDLGIHPGYDRGRRVPVRLCAVPGFRSSSAESTPGDEFYVPRASGRVIVSSRVSGAVLALFHDARRRGLVLQATSSYRTQPHQVRLCRTDPACRTGDHTYVAPPGHSNHQLGLAVDVRGTYVKGGASCRRRAVDPSSRAWRFLERHAQRHGFRQYAAESWHWDPMTGPDRC